MSDTPITHDGIGKLLRVHQNKVQWRQVKKPGSCQSSLKALVKVNRFPSSHSIVRNKWVVCSANEQKLIDGQWQMYLDNLLHRYPWQHEGVVSLGAGTYTIEMLQQAKACCNRKPSSRGLSTFIHVVSFPLVILFSCSFTCEMLIRAFWSRIWHAFWKTWHVVKNTAPNANSWNGRWATKAWNHLMWFYVTHSPFSQG